jgi:putative transposase
MGSWRAGCGATRMSGSAARAGETDCRRRQHRAPARPIHFRMHPGARAEPVLCAWGITTQGSPVLVGLAPGSHEGHDPWAAFLGELVARGLRAPLLVITDGAPGLLGAVELVFASSLRQRCLVHRSRKEIVCRFPSLGLAGVVCAHARTGGGP